MHALALPLTPRWRRNNRLVWKKNQFNRQAMHAGGQDLTDLDGQGGDGKGSKGGRPRNSWGDDLGAPAEGEEAAAAVGASRGVAQYDDDEVLDF